MLQRIEQLEQDEAEAETEDAARRAMRRQQQLWMEMELRGAGERRDGWLIGSSAWARVAATTTTTNMTRRRTRNRRKIVYGRTRTRAITHAHESTQERDDNVLLCHHTQGLQHVRL